MIGDIGGSRGRWHESPPGAIAPWVKQAPSDTRRKQLKFRATHRGFKETDAILGAFAALHLTTLDSDELDMFAALLDLPDHELYDWLRGARPVPPAYDTSVFSRLKALCERSHPTWNV